MTFSHYDDDTLTDVRYALSEAHNSALLARLGGDEVYYQNICAMVNALEDAAGILGFDLVKREEKTETGRVLRMPDSVSLPCDTEPPEAA